MNFETQTVDEVTEKLIDYRGATPEKTTSGVHLVTAKVIKGGYILDSNPEYIAEENYDAWMRRGLPQRGDILITTEAPLGEVALIRQHEKIALAQRVILLRGDQSKIDQGFYFQALKSPFVQSELYSRSSGTTVAGIKQSELRQVKIPTPPLPIQRKIAGILGAYDDLIENNARRIQILEQMAAALYREWFIERRFPGHETAPMGEELPLGWEWKKLGEVVELAYGKALKADTRKSGDVPVYGSSGVTGYHDESLVEGPGIIVGRKGNVGSVFWSPRDFFPIDTVYFVRSQVSLFYVFYNFKDQNFINNDAAVPGLNRNQAYSLPFLVPSMDVLESFDEFTRPIFDQLENLAARNALLRQTRDVLLPRLLSGEVDVSELSIALEDAQ